MTTVRGVGVVDVSIGHNVTIIEPCNLYGCTLQDDVFIGPFVEVQRGVWIGRQTRIQSHSFICELVKIGSGCSVAHGVMFINDTYSTGKPANRDKSLWKNTEICDNVIIGSNATILPVYICQNTVIGAGAVVTKDITKPGIYAGNPAKFLRNI